MLRVTGISPENAALFTDFLSRQAKAMYNTHRPLLMLGLLEDEAACGALTGYLETPSLFRINGIFVAPQVRRHGGAALMLRVLGELLAEEEQVTTIQLDYVEFGPEEQGLTALLSAAEFRQRPPEIPFFGTTLAKLMKSDFFSVSDSPDPSILPFSEMPDHLVRVVDKHFSAGGTPILQGPLLGSALERELSVGYSDGRTVPAFVVVTCHEGRLHIALLYTEPEFSSRLPAVLRMALRRALPKYAPETVVTMQTVSPKGEAIARRIMEGSGFRNLARRAELSFEKVGIF